jgi:hypothetical protein
MKIFKNVLDQETLINVQKDIEYLSSKNAWVSSQMCWSKYLLGKMTGDCISTYVSSDIGNEIKKCISDKLPPAKELIIQYYVWKQNSGIALHDDGAHTYGATIYLNNNWDINSGGIFLWEEGDNLKGICPEYNTMILNDEHELHLVTTVSPLITEFRYTIQIWGV